MLPFLDKKKTVSLLMSRRGKSPDIEVKPEVDAPGHEMNPALKEAAADILRAIEVKSVTDLAKAMEAAFDVLESMPHEEGPHIGEDEEEGEE